MCIFVQVVLLNGEAGHFVSPLPNDTFPAEGMHRHELGALHPDASAGNWAKVTARLYVIVCLINDKERT